MRELRWLDDQILEQLMVKLKVPAWLILRTEAVEKSKNGQEDDRVAHQDEGTCTSVDLYTELCN